MQVFPWLAHYIHGADPEMALDAGKNLYNVFITVHGVHDDLLHGHAGR